MLLLSGCERVPSLQAALPGLPGNPFALTPTADREPMAAAAQPSPSPTPSPVPFAAYWVKNHRQTEMWSGPAGQTGVVSFGTTSAQFCVFQVVRPQDGSRLYALNPYSKGYFWIDADAVGPVSEAPKRGVGPKPADANCAEDLYDS